MKYKNEVQVKEALGIDSFRNLSKDKVMRFAAMMPDMDKEVALAIVKQFPAFKEFALEAVGTLERAQSRALDGNDASQARVHDAWQDVRDILKEQLKDDDLSWEQKQYIFDLIMTIAREQGTSDTKNKEFLKDIMKNLALGVGAVVALGVVFVGGKIALEQSSENSDNEI